MHGQRGFTLLELLVATAIVVVIGVGSTMIFGQAVNNRERVGERAQALAELQRGFLFMQRDFEQIVARPARDELGDEQPFLMSTADGAVELTHTGWTNPLNARQHGSIQRVRYRLADGKLWRDYWEHPDRQAGSVPVSSVLMENVIAFDVRFLSKPIKSDYRWEDTWPLATERERQPQYQRAPLAVSVEIETKRLGVLKRFFRIVANPHARET
ncbi:MAG: type II secretion system minor pseudopilin GspJ [Pseudomonadota bacterium]